MVLIDLAHTTALQRKLKTTNQVPADPSKFNSQPVEGTALSAHRVDEMFDSLRSRGMRFHWSFAFILRHEWHPLIAVGFHLPSFCFIIKFNSRIELLYMLMNSLMMSSRGKGNLISGIEEQFKGSHINIHPQRTTNWMGDRLLCCHSIPVAVDCLCLNSHKTGCFDCCTTNNRKLNHHIVHIHTTNPQLVTNFQ